MSDEQIEKLMQVHYWVWLAFTAETPIEAHERWQQTNNAHLGFAEARRRRALNRCDR